MNQLEFFLSIERSNRQTGRTTALAKACQEMGGIFIVPTEAMGKDLKKKFPDLDIRGLDPSGLVGTTKPIILDHLTWSQILSDYNIESKRLRADIQETRRQLLKIKNIVNSLNL